jgi:transcriptional regulator with XRE-family HTH domain
MNINLNKVKDLAKERNLKIKDVLAGIEIAQTTLDQQIRKKNIDLQSYVKICKYFDVSLDFFIEDDFDRKDNVNVLKEPVTNYSTKIDKCEKCEEKERLINAQHETIRTQKAMITMLQDENKKMKIDLQGLTKSMPAQSS